MPPDDGQAISTGGGAYIQGDVYTGGGDFIAGDKYEIHFPAEKDARARRDQLILLEKVRSFWVEGVLERTLHRTARLALGMESHPGLIAHPWETLVELPARAPTPLPREKPIAAVFEEAGRALLILGEPGAGKTITLLELARDLLERAAKDPLQPIPVVLNLAAWGADRAPFAEWAVGEIHDKYQVPTKIAAAWLADFDLLLLLDGLDEVAGPHRQACVEALNAFAADHGLCGLAVCSRLTEYEALETKLRMRGAVVLQPLSPEKIAAHVEAAGAPLAGLKQALVEDPALAALARSPLMLSVMELAYAGQPAAAAGQSDAPPETRRAQIFEAYVGRMLQRPRSGEAPAPEQTTGWLSRLAKGMAAHNQAVFQIEALQPSWLKAPKNLGRYVLLSRALSGMVLGVGIGALGYGDPLYLLLGAGIGLAAGLITGWVTARRFARAQTGPRARRVPAIGLSVGIPFALLAGVLGFASLTVDLVQEFAAELGDYRILALGLFGLLGGVIAALFVGALMGGIFELVFGRRLSWQRPEEDIRTVDALRWTWPEAFKMTGRGALIAALFGPVLALPLSLAAGDGPAEMVVLLPLVCCLAGAVFAVFGALLGMVIGGLRGVAIPEKTSPNQGIWLSVRNALIVGGLSGLAIGLLNAIFSPPDSAIGWVEGLLRGMPIGFLVVLYFGVLDFIQHFVLRFYLWREGALPWRYAWFLDRAADLVLLRKVGGGYIFAHRLLQEYFAGLEEGG